MNALVASLLFGVALGALPAWWITSDHYQGVIAKEHEQQQRNVIEQQEKNRLALLAYAERITTAGAEHDKNARIIRNLGHELDGLRINFPTCPVPDIAKAGVDPDRAARLLSDAVDDDFAELQKQTGKLVERCDELNIDAIRANSIQKE